MTAQAQTTQFPAYVLEASWRIRFMDANGVPLTMASFEIIDFGAISYREIFQNVKTVLSTIVGTVPLERTLGVDQDIVDRPINRADDAVVAVHAALFFWEPRVEVMRISFAADVPNGHLICNLALKIKNLIYGTQQPYSQSNFFPEPMKVQQGLPPMQEPVLIPGPPGAPGRRGSLWFTGATDPDPDALPTDVLPQDMYLNTTSGDVFQFVASPGVGTLRVERKTL